MTFSTQLRRVAPLVALVALAGTTALARAAADRATSALINEQLDKFIRLKLNDSPLPKVLDSIEEQTGVPVRPDADVYDLLPYGTQTPITLTVENLSLRDALTALGAKLGLRIELKDEYVALVPQPALRRLGRRVTLQELRTLDALAGRPFKTSASGPPDAIGLTKVVDDSLLAYDAELQRDKQPPAKIVVEVRSTEGLDRSKQASIELPRGATLLDALEALAAQTKLTWYPWGDSVVVLPKRDVIRGLLERPAELRYDGVDVAQVLVDLAKRTGVAFSIEPGAIQRVPPEFRIVRLSADAPVRQALESLQGFTGLGYVITDAGVYVWNQNSSPAAGSRGRVVATVEVTPGTNALVYEDQLSQAARDMLEAKRKAATAALERSLAGPATRP